MSALDAARDEAIWLRMSELKLPGASDGAKEEPRGPKDMDDVDNARAPFVAAGGCRPSRSKLERDGATPCGRGGWP
jgi:hypothetical protein